MGGIGLERPATVVGNTEATTAQILQLAQDAGQQLMMEPFKWQELQAEFTITTVPGTPNYALPTDFGGFEADASWNRTTRLPVLGSLTEREWQMLKARLAAGTTFTVLFQIVDNEVVFYDTPTSVQTIVMPYTSRGWVRNAADTQRQDTILLDTDVVLFDPQMFKTKLKWMWYEQKGFDTTKVEKTFNRVSAAAKANDVPGRTLSLARGADYPYLGMINVPDQGYGP